MSTLHLTNSFVLPEVGTARRRLRVGNHRHRAAAMQELVLPDEVEWLASDVLSMSCFTGWNMAESLAMRLRQLGMRYLEQPDGTGLWRSPKATLMKRAGDCDDMALFVASGILACEMPGYVALGMRRGRYHACALGQDEAGWFWLDPSSWAVTRLPRRPRRFQPAVVFDDTTVETWLGFVPTLAR